MGSPIELAKTLLFVPATRLDRVSKAAASGADVVVIDLEDAVPPQEKERGRAGLEELESVVVPTIVRVNGPTTPWWNEDLAAVAALARVDGVLLPKVEKPEHIRQASKCLGEGRSVVALIETAVAMVEIATLARTPGLTRLAFGALDFALDSGVSDEGESLTGVRAQIAIHSRAAGLPAPVDGISTAIDDTEALFREARASLMLGFGGKLCIHPRQVSAVRDVFVPTPHQMDWARRVVKASEEAGGQPLSLDGEMVDLPVVTRAQKILERGAGRVS